MFFQYNKNAFPNIYFTEKAFFILLLHFLLIYYKYYSFFDLSTQAQMASIAAPRKFFSSSARTP